MFTFDGKDFSGLLYVNSFPRVVLPPQKVDEVKVVDRAGAVFTGTSSDPVDLPFEVTVVAREQFAAKVRELGSYLYRAQPRRLLLNSDPGWYTRAIVSDALELKMKAPFWGTGTITFHCSDPAWYAVEDDVWLVDGPESPIPDKQRVGNVESFPLVRIDGTSSGTSGNHIEFSLNGTVVDFRGRLDAGDSLYLDSQWLTAYVVDADDNRRSAIGDLAALTFPVAVPGANTLSVAGYGDAAATTLRVECRSRSL